MNRGAWQATVRGVAKSQACLSNYHSLHGPRAGLWCCPQMSHLKAAGQGKYPPPTGISQLLGDCAGEAAPQAPGRLPAEGGMEPESQGRGWS